MPSKLCPHTLNAHPDVQVFVEAGSPAVKLVGFFGQAEALLTLRPDLVVVGRVYEPYDANAAARSGRTPEDEARAWVERQAETYRLNPAIRLWEGPNEPAFGSAGDPENVRAMAWYAAFEAERLRRLAGLDLRGVVGNFATGNPDLPLWEAFLPAVAAARELRGYLGLHEYSSPWMWWLTGTYQSSNCAGEAPVADEADTGWLTLRYRKAYRQYLAPNGLGDVPLLITECGLDTVGPVCPGHTSGPWTIHPEFWRGQDGARDPIDYWRGGDRDPERYYAEQLIWYDRELQKDPFVVGATIFTVGTIGAGWQPYDIGGTRAVRFLAEYMQTQREAGPPTDAARDEPAAVLTPAIGPASDGSLPTLVIVPPGPGARAEAQPSLLFNAGFEEGKAYLVGDDPELAIPAGWGFSYADEATPELPGQTAPFGRPAAALITSLSIPVEDRDRIFGGSAYCWRVTVGRPVWIRLFQSLAGLTPGLRYRLEANLLPDLGAASPLSGEARLEARLEARFDSGTFDSGWKTEADLHLGRYTRLHLDFAAPSHRVLVALELRSRWAMPHGAWYVDELSLTAS